MEHFAIQLPQPINPSKAVAKEFAKLTATVADLANKRRQTAAQHAALESSMRNYHSNGKSETPAAVQTHVEMHELEKAQLDAELATWPQVEALLVEMSASRANEKAVVAEMVNATREHVRAIYERDFPADTFFVREAALANLINHHPAVLGALDAADAADVAATEKDALEFNAVAVQKAARRLDAVTKLLDQSRSHLKAAIARQQAAEAAEANRLEAERQRDESIRSARAAAASEARKRLAMESKKV